MEIESKAKHPVSHCQYFGIFHLWENSARKSHSSDLNILFSSFNFVIIVVSSQFLIRWIYARLKYSFRLIGNFHRFVRINRIANIGNSRWQITAFHARIFRLNDGCKIDVTWNMCTQGSLQVLSSNWNPFSPIMINHCGLCVPKHSKVCKYQWISKIQAVLVKTLYNFIRPENGYCESNKMP